LKKIVLVAISVLFLSILSMNFAKPRIEAASSSKHILVIDDDNKYAYFGWYRASQMAPTGWELLQRTVNWANSYRIPNQTDVVLFTYNGDIEPPVDHSQEDGYAIYLWLVDQGYNVTVHHQADSETLLSTYYSDYDLVIYWHSGYIRDGTNIVNSGIPFITVGYFHTDEMGIGTGARTMHDVRDTFYVENNNYYPTLGYPLGLLEFESSIVTDATEAANNGIVLVQARPVHNINTGLDYATIQEAIDAPETLDGHTIRVDAGTYYEHMTVDKSVSLVGESRQNTIVDGGGDGRIFEILSNVRISEFTIQNGHAGVNTVGEYNTISGNVIQNNHFGVDNVGWSQNISGNFITNNAGIGIFLHWSDGNIIGGNTITCNGRGISLQHACTDNIIINNTITDNEFAGIQLFRADNDYPTNNTISGNDMIDNEIGIWLSGASGNSIFHNNFIGNADQVLIKPEYPSINTWDDGYPSGGNHWSDYAGVDLYGGPYQNETGSDGIGDTPYVIDEDNTDRYPLFPRLIEITNTSISKTVTNDTITYLAAVVTSDILPFDVSAFYDDTLIGTKTVTELLIPGNFMVVTFRWNTTDVPLGKYNISFSISLYPNQKYLAGNVSEVPQGEIKPDGVINIRDIYAAAIAFGSSTIREDINCDGIVDEIDICIVQWAFGTYPGHSRWNPDADVNEDGQVQIADIGAMAKAFGAVAHPRWNQLADLNNDRQVNIIDIFIIAKNYGYEYLWDDP